ncbi:DUF3224 domain-containing protein [Plantactinospora mayteni]|uniref:DUF3224 domain-containing protein n=1 Tax=Plantactinospora mayteni TaxID=566021 RepID=A0ABQ4F3Z7_9ACTN|nr:DUF3224 domain-containing protein [Plantactinospora mayteni]GIH01634.1 hypothetical protein Pma05_82060 [Plantactinospora mayteni]
MTRQTGTALAPGTEFTAEFEVTGWDEQPYDEPAEGGTLARVTVRKSFRGAIEGTSVAELLTAANRGYVASERFTGSIDGQHGTVVFQHGGLDAEPPRTFGHVVPGTGTGGLTGLLGTISYRHDESGHSVRLVLD